MKPPRTFTDTAGHTWTVTVTDQGRRMLFGDGADVFDRVAYHDWQDICRLVAVLSACCKDEAQRAGITTKDFARRLTGSTLDAAAAALRWSIVDALPTGTAAKLQKVWRLEAELARLVEA